MKNKRLLFIITLILIVSAKNKIVFPVDKMANGCDGPGFMNICTSSQLIFMNHSSVFLQRNHQGWISLHCPVE